MKPKKGNLKKAQRTQSEEITEVKFKNEEPTYQILGNAGGDYIKTTLPKNFFENVTLGEMSLEFDFSIEKLTKLTDLYSLGIQYYLENNPIQAKHFQDRMGYILTNKDVLSKLKKQQEEEKKEQENCEKKEYPKSARNLPHVSMRKRARTNFIVKSKNINSDDIQKKVSFVLKDTDKEKEEKENVKNIIKEEFNKQNLNWKERLKNKKAMNTSFGLGIRPRNKTFMARAKKFQTPGPVQGRGVMILKSPNRPKSPSQDNNPLDFKKRENMRNKHYMNFIDNESSEMDELEKNEGDLDFMKQFKEKHYSKEEENKDNDNKDKDDKDDKDKDNDSEENLNIEKESNENQINKKNKKKKNDTDSDSDSDSESSESMESEEFLKKIDEVDEEKEAMSLRQTARKGELTNKLHEIKENELMFEENKEKNESINDNSLSTQTTEIRNENYPFKRKKSIVDEENVIRNISLDDEIQKIVEEKMKKLENLNSTDKDNKIDDDSSDDEASNNAENQIKQTKVNIDDIPVKFQETYTEVEIIMDRYVKDLNKHFYKDTFEIFTLELKDLYDKKYNKYIEVNKEYHNSIKEKEYQLDNDENLNEEKKAEIQQIIDSLKEEQKDQIDKITDEYNELIDKKISDYKMTFFKKDCEINLMEEQLKLDIYTMINESFY